MKSLILLTALLANSAYSMPVLNRSAPAGEGIMVYVDHLDPNLYYLSPESISVQTSADGRPMFSYIEYYENGSIFSEKLAIIQLLMMPAFNTEKIKAAETKILEVNPKALFASLPFVDSSIAFTPYMQKLVIAGSCRNGAGDVGQAVSCTLSLTPQGRKVIGKLLKTGNKISVQFNYMIEGVNQLPDGSYINKETPITAAGSIGGQNFLDHPDIFKQTHQSGWPN